MKFELRDYQRSVVKLVKEALRDTEPVLVVAGTGSGKTAIAAYLISLFLKHHKRGLFLVHLDCLVEQTKATLIKMGVFEGFIGVIKSGYKEDPYAMIQIASLQTIASHLSKADKRKLKGLCWEDMHYDFMFFDEAHTTTFFESGIKLRELFPKARVIGLTATPWLLDKKRGMGDVYKHLVKAPIPAQLMEQGHLISKVRYLSLSGADLSKVDLVGGDYSLKQLGTKCNTNTLVKKGVDEYCTHAMGKRAISFCVDVNHAKAVDAEFNRRGIPSKVVVASTPIPERQVIYQELAAGKILNIASVYAIGTGFDCPAVEVELMLRPTQSRSLYFQMLGRALRISPSTKKTEALILDQAGNVRKFGGAEDLTEDDFKLLVGRGDDFKIGEPLRKPCGKCGSLVHIAARLCPECGYEFPEKDKVQQSSELVELTAEARKAAKKEKKKVDYHPTEAFKSFIDPYIQEFLDNGWGDKSIVTNKLYAWKGYLGVGDYLYLAKQLGYKPQWAYMKAAERSKRFA